MKIQKTLALLAVALFVAAPASAVTLSGTPTALPAGTTLTPPIPTATFNPAEWLQVDQLVSTYDNGSNFYGTVTSTVYNKIGDGNNKLLFTYQIDNTGNGYANPTILSSANFVLNADVEIEDAGLVLDGDVSPDLVRRDANGETVRWFFIGTPVSAGQKQDTLFLGTTSTTYERNFATVQDSPSSVEDIAVLVPGVGELIIPEPATMVALFGGVAGVAGYIRKRKNA